MSVTCSFCHKVFSNPAALNFHKSKVHHVQREQNVQSSSESNADSDGGAALCLVNLPRFKVFSIPESESDKAKNVATNPNESPQVATKEPPKRKRGRKPKTKKEGSNTSNPATTPAADNVITKPETPTSSSSIGRTRNVREKGEVKRTRLADANEFNKNEAFEDDSLTNAQRPTGSSPSSASSETTSGEVQHATTGSRLNKGIFQCPVCEKTGFKNRNHYINHLEIHEGKRPYLCPICEYGYETDLKLLEHVSMKHSSEPAFSCDKCGNSYKMRVHFRRHKCRPPPRESAKTSTVVDLTI